MLLGVKMEGSKVLLTLPRHLKIEIRLVGPISRAWRRVTTVSASVTSNAYLSIHRL